MKKELIVENEESKRIDAYISENTEYSTEFVRNDSQVLLTDENVDVLLNNKIKQIMIIDSNIDEVKKYQNLVEEEYKLNVMNSSYDEKEEIWFSIASTSVCMTNALEDIKKEASYITLSNDQDGVAEYLEKLLK